MEKYQTLIPRFFALILDTILLLPIGIGAELLGENYIAENFSATLSSLAGLLGVTYFVAMHAVFGQTVGKMLTKVKVLDISGSRLSFKQAFVRDLPQIVFNIAAVIPVLNSYPVGSPEFIYSPVGIVAIIWGLADILVFFVTDKRRALHDLIAGSVVVKIDPVHERSET